MASLNKQSIREELARLKSEFDRLSSGNQLSTESRILMQSLFTLLELIFAIFLEKSTTKNSRNSSLPPSQTEEDKSALERPGSKGKGKSENPESAANTRTVETVTIAEVLTCHICGEDLSHVRCHHHKERRTKIDIVFEKVIEHVDAEEKRCPYCKAQVKAQFPEDMPGPRQYGLGIKAYAISMLVCQMVSLSRAKKCINAMLGEMISEATLLKFVMRLHEALATWENDAIDQLLASLAMNVDETSLRVDKNRHWIHVYSAGDITLKRLHRRRGLEAMELIDIIPRYGGVIIHDCWSSYLSYEHCGHGLCGSHLLRELTFIVDAHNYTWARHMKQLLRRACKNVSASESKTLTDQEFKNLQKRYRAILTAGEKELPLIPEKPSGRRGKMAKSSAHNLLERMRDYEASVLLFARHPHVAFTNNRAERDLRMAKVKQKVSGCFRSVEYAHAYCRISSYLQTMASKGHNPLIAIQMALSGNIGGE